MATYRRRFISEPQTSVPLEPLRGSRLMSRARASAVHATGDRVLSHGRRILCSVGLHGAEKWGILDTGVSAWSHPDATTPRVVARTPPIRLTPGHFVRAVVVANPSGLTTQPDGLGGFESGGPKGVVRVAATYINGSSSTVTRDISIPASGLANAAQPSGGGAAWAQLHRRRSSLLLPADMTAPANLAAWCDGATVELAVSYIGSPRAVDVVVFEEPLALTYDLAAGGWAAPMHAAANGADLGQLAGPVPVTRRSVSDPGGGTEIVCDAAARLCQELGPVLLFASAYDESNTTISAAETDAKVLSGVSFRDFITTATTSYDATKPGWSASSGANARRVQDSEERAVLRDLDNVVPVRCYIYASLSGSNTGIARIETADYSVAEVRVTGTNYAWFSAPGHLRCGLGAQDPTCLQVKGRTLNAGVSLRWRYLLVVYENL